MRKKLNHECYVIHVCADVLYGFFPLFANNAHHSLALVAGAPTRCVARRPCALRYERPEMAHYSHLFQLSLLFQTNFNDFLI